MADEHGERHKDAHVVHDRRQRAEVSPDAKAEAPQGEVDRLRREASEAREHYLRALADVDNTKKRLQREKEESSKYAAETIIRELLPILDSLDQAVTAVDAQSQANAVVKGVHLIYRQLLGLLEKEGVKRIVTIGQPFDPHQHEAVGHVEAKDGQADGTIVEEVQVGYTMHGKVIRPAMVKVANTTSEHV